MPNQTPFLDVSLQPSRSLSPRGFLALMLVLGSISAVAGIWFYLKGAWPILGFFGLDMALLYWAFKVSYREGTLSERIRIDDAAMTIERRWPGRDEARWTLHPAWVQVKMERPGEHDARLTVRERGQDVRIGTFLPPLERSEVADLIKDGLDRRKRALLR